MAPGEWSLVGVHEVVAAAVPDREMVICGDTRRTYAEVAARSRGLAAYLLARRVGIERERDQLERWEIGQAPVALVLHNGAEYLEAMLGSWKARAVPFNVNQHYRVGEITALLADVGVRAVVYHRRYGRLVAAGCDLASVVLLDVDDGSGTDPLPGSTPYEEAVATPVTEPLPEPSPDDLYMVCTGGTTGRPKAVLWRQADIYVAAMAGSEDATAESIAAGAKAWAAGPWYAVPPLMHAAAQWTAFCGLHCGATVLLHDDSQPFDPAVILGNAERERAFMMSIVGDAYAGPLVAELRRRPYDLSAMFTIGTGGAATGDHHKDAIVELLPHVTVMDGYGASETGGMAFGPRTKDQRRDSFVPSTGATVASADRTRFLEPGEDEVGWIARRARVPLGYLGDPERTDATFPVIDGERVAIPGDRGRLLPDGSIGLLGRDSMVVNSGGEKVYVEEVEAVLRTHPDVADALVVGRPSDRFGQEVVAVVSPRDGATVEPVALRAFVAEEIARFKAPRAVAVVERVQRLANGKADYAWAKEAARTATDATRSP
jgi:acyl-CoA synthetase (AMP-forming)/AMP-acid ligase II